MLLQVAATLCVLWVVTSCLRNRRLISLYWKLRNNKIPLPFLGHSYLLRGDSESRMTALQKLGMEAIDNNGLLAMWHAQRLYIFVSDPKLAEFVLKNCLEKDEIMKYMRSLTGNGSVFAPANIWRRRRKLMAPTFSPKNLAEFVKIFSRQSQTLAKKLKELSGRGVSSVWPYMSNYALDSVCETALGVNVDAQNVLDHPVQKAIETLCKMGSVRICRPWIRNSVLFKALPYYPLFTKHTGVLYNFVDKIVAAKREMVKDNPNITSEAKGLKTFLELFMESSGQGQGFTNLELREEMLVLAVAGTDTSAVGSSFTALMLAKYPLVQERVYQEVLKVFGSSMCDVTAEQLSSLKYLEAVIKETLRLYPPIPVIVRETDKEVTLPNGVTLLKDCGILVHISAIHRNPQYWGVDAGQFNPERFLNLELSHPAAYMPFSYGQRSCLGMQYAMLSMKTALSYLIHNYRILPSSDVAACSPENIQSETANPLRVKFDIMLKHVDKFCLRLENRNTA